MGGWDGIETFIAVCETEGFSALLPSWRIGCRYVPLYRTTRQVSMTDAGRAFLELLLISERLKFQVIMKNLRTNLKTSKSLNIVICLNK